MFLLFFEAAAIPVFAMIAFAGSARRERIKAAYYFIMFTAYGSVSMLLTLLSVFSAQRMEDYIGSMMAGAVTFWLLLFVAFAVKVPLFPTHIWLPYAHVEASTTASIVLASLLLKLGGYGILKFLLPAFNCDIHIFFQSGALLICLIGLIYGGLCALRQADIKRQIAFSSVAHMSFAVLGIFTYTEAGAKGSLYLMVSHGLTAAALFFMAGALSDRHHTRSVFAYGGLIQVMPTLIAFFIYISLANIGFPGTSGFVPELILIVATISTTLYILAPVMFGMFISAAAALLLMLRIAFGHIKGYSRFQFADATRIESFVLGVLGVCIL
jgi:NADH-quinone oxidoreductase subunit M